MIFARVLIFTGILLMVAAALVALVDILSRSSTSSWDSDPNAVLCFDVTRSSDSIIKASRSELTEIKFTESSLGHFRTVSIESESRQKELLFKDHLGVFWRVFEFGSGKQIRVKKSNSRPMYVDARKSEHLIRFSSPYDNTSCLHKVQSWIERTKLLANRISKCQLRYEAVLFLPETWKFIRYFTDRLEHVSGTYTFSESLDRLVFEDKVLNLLWDGDKLTVSDSNGKVVGIC